MKNLSPYKYTNTSQYFSDFFKINSKSKNKFSIRSFSNQISWPTSYFSDLVSGRKNLTCIRAIEFGQFTKLSPHEIEYLIFLGLKSSMPEKFSSFLTKNTLGTKNKDLHLNPSQFEECRNINLLLLYTVISWSNGKLTVEEITELLSEQNIEKKEIENLLIYFVKNKVVKFNKNKIKVITNKSFANDEAGEGISLHKGYAENLITFCTNPHPPASLFSGFIELPLARFNEIEAKVLALRNYLYEVTQEKNLKRNSDLSKNMVFQFDLNLFPMINKDKIKKLSKQNKI